MRTTVTIDDGLLQTVKARAERDRTTLGAVIEAALRRHLAEPASESPGVPLPSFATGGLQPGVDPLSNASLLAAADAP